MADHQKVCAVLGCEKARKGQKQFCEQHYRRFTRHGDPLVNKRDRPDRERFEEKIDKNASPDCWEWTATKDSNGYGMLASREAARDGKKMERAHRFAYRLYKGPIPDGLYLDHICRNKSCVNPDHLEPVTNSENIKRGDLWQNRKTHCPRGHPYSGDNLRFGSSGSRRCAACEKERSRARRGREIAEDDGTSRTKEMRNV